MRPRLAIAAVGPVAWVLCHVGVYDVSVSRRVAKALHLVGLRLTERDPTARRSGHVGVDRPVNVGRHCTALRTRLRFVLLHASMLTAAR
jgi:hypothetical protein